MRKSNTIRYFFSLLFDFFQADERRRERLLRQDEVRFMGHPDSRSAQPQEWKDRGTVTEIWRTSFQEIQNIGFEGSEYRESIILNPNLVRLEQSERV